MPAAAQHLGLEAGLAVQRDEAADFTEPLPLMSFSTMPTRLLGM